MRSCADTTPVPHAAARPTSFSPRARRAATVIGALTLGLTACAGPTPIDIVQGTTPNSDVLALRGEPGSLIESALDRLPGLADEALEQSGVPGMAIAVVHGGQTVYTGGFGLTEAGSGTPIAPDTVFQVASLSKPLSATAIAAAIGASNGELGWDNSIKSTLPDFAFSDETVTRLATIGDAFSHRTGLATGAGDDLEDLGYDRDTILERLGLQPLDAFRSSYHYSNFGITVGAEAVVAARGEAWEDLIDELVFAPLGMTSTSARHDDFISHTDRARLHALEDGTFIANYDRDPDPESPAGGVSSSAEDLARWMQLLLAVSHEEDVSAKLAPGVNADAFADALTEAMSPQTISGTGPGLTGRPAHYGYGFNVSPLVSGRMAISHSGAFVLGAATTFQIVPDLDLGIVVLTNGAPVGLPEAVAAEFLDLVQYGEVTRDWVTDTAGFFAGYTAPLGDLVGVPRPSAPAAQPDPAQLIGIYDSPYFGELIVETAEGGSLQARLGRGGATVLTLEPWDGSVFAYAPLNESAPYGSLASATFAPDGLTLRLSSFDDHELGTWTRRG